MNLVIVLPDYQRIQNGGFRQDLYYRIARFTVEVPTLRERREDIPLLAQHFMQLFAEEMGIPVPVLTPEALQVLQEADFPGNIRELKNTVERALIEGRGGDIKVEHLKMFPSVVEGRAPTAEEDNSDLPWDLDSVERIAIQRALDKTKGNVAAAARLLRVDRSRIYRKRKESGVETNEDNDKE